MQDGICISYKETQGWSSAYTSCVVLLCLQLLLSSALGENVLPLLGVQCTAPVSFSQYVNSFSFKLGNKSTPIRILNDKSVM